MRRLVEDGIQPRVPGRARGGGRGQRGDRRRVPLYRRAAGAHRPVGGRGRSPHHLRSGRPAIGEPLEQVVVFGCRELGPDRRGASPCARARRRRAVGTRPLGPSGRRPVVRRDGVLAPLARTTTRCILPDLLGDEARIVLVEPRRRATGPPSSRATRRHWPRRSQRPGERPR